MDWLKHWNLALDYLEENLCGEIKSEELGRLACCSAYHFQRMFSYIAGIPISEYIRRRKMSRAALDLQRGDRVVDVAVRYGYDSPTAFNRAFQNIHGLPPSAARQEDVKLKSFPRIRFKFVLKGETEMEYRIIKREEFRIVGFRTPLPKEAEEGFQVVPKFWSEVGPRVAELLPVMNGDPMGVLGVSTCHRETDNYYYIAVSSDAPVPDGMFEEQIPAATWAVFDTRGTMPEAIQQLQCRIVSEWLPDSGYEWAQAPDIEVYLSQPGVPEAEFQVWLPVTKVN